MILEDFSSKDKIETLDNINTEIDETNLFDDNKDKQNIDFSVDLNNNLVISLNLTKKVIKSIKKNSSVKLEFQLSKEFYLSILEDFK